MRAPAPSPSPAGKKSSTPKSGRGRGRGRPAKQSPSSAPPPAKQDPEAMAPAEETPQEEKVGAEAAAEEKKAEMEGKLPVAAAESAAVAAEGTDKEAKDTAEVAEGKVGENGKSEGVVEVNKRAQEEVKEQEVEEGKGEDGPVNDRDVSVAEGTKEEENKEEEERSPANNGGMDAAEEEQQKENCEEPVEGEEIAVEGGGGGEGEAVAEGQGHGEAVDKGQGQGEEVDERQGEEDSAHVHEDDEDEQMMISDMAEKRKLKKELEIFVGGLDRHAVEEDIKKAFEQVGEVVEIRLHKDFATNKNKGFAFVKFANKEQVARALAQMKNPLIRGKRCGVAASEDNDTLFLGNICNTWTKEAIKKKLRDYGIEGVVSLTLVPDTQNEGLSRGFAFLEFSCHADAMLAFKRLQKPDVVFGHPERTAKVAFAEPLREPDPEVMAKVKCVFVDGLPPYWDEDRVKDQFKGYGEIERVVLARNMSSAKRNDFGFVNFTTHEAALACIEGTNDTELGDDGKSKVKVRARLANPLPKTQAVKGGMSGGFRIGYSGAGFNRFGRGFGRGRSFPHWTGFQGGRGFSSHARGRGGRYNIAANSSFEASPSDFRGRRPFGFRGGGGRWQSSDRHGSFDRGLGRGFPPARRPPFEPEGDFGGPFGEDPYFYGDGGHGVKRPFSMMEHDPGYFEPDPRVRPRFDYHDALPGGSRYRESFGMGDLYSRNYFGPGPDQYGSSTYSSLYRGEHSRGGYYY